MFCTQSPESCCQVVRNEPTYVPDRGVSQRVKSMAGRERMAVCRGSGRECPTAFRIEAFSSSKHGVHDDRKLAGDSDGRPLEAKAFA